MKSIAPILAALALLLLLLGGYVGAYLGMGKKSVWRGSAPPESKLVGIDREYSHEWIATAFKPAAWVESKVRGLDVKAMKYQSLSDYVNKATSIP